MEWSTCCALARARVLALHGMLLDGGVVESWQLCHAIEPIVGDLLPLPRAGERDPALAQLARAAGLAWEEIAAGRREVKSSRGRRVPGSTVVPNQMDSS